MKMNSRGNTQIAYLDLYLNLSSRVISATQNTPLAQNLFVLRFVPKQLFDSSISNDYS